MEYCAAVKNNRHMECSLRRISREEESEASDALSFIYVKGGPVATQVLANTKYISGRMHEKIKGAGLRDCRLREERFTLLCTFFNIV